MYLHFLSFSPATQAPKGYLQIKRSGLHVLEKMGEELLVSTGWGWVHRGWCLAWERERENDTDFQGLHSFSCQNSIPQQSSAWYRIAINHLKCPSKAVFFLHLFIVQCKLKKESVQVEKNWMKLLCRTALYLTNPRNKKFTFLWPLLGSYTSRSPLC